MSLKKCISADTQFLDIDTPLELESGGSLPQVRVAYRTWGRPRRNATLVCHALTGSADADDWWADLFGPGRALDPERDYIVSANVLGGCYGTTEPSFHPGDSRDILQAVMLRGIEVEGDALAAASTYYDRDRLTRLKLSAACEPNMDPTRISTSSSVQTIWPTFRVGRKAPGW